MWKQTLGSSNCNWGNLGGVLGNLGGVFILSKLSSERLGLNTVKMWFIKEEFIKEEFWAEKPKNGLFFFPLKIKILEKTAGGARPGFGGKFYGFILMCIYFYVLLILVWYLFICVFVLMCNLGRVLGNLGGVFVLSNLSLERLGWV